jgi:hypothetical protein
MGTIDAASLFRRIVEPGAGGGLQVHKKMKREKCQQLLQFSKGHSSANAQPFYTS